MAEVPRAMSGWIRCSSAYRNLDHNYGEKKNEKTAPFFASVGSRRCETLQSLPFTPLYQQEILEEN
jgi:hypothetical protein